MANDDSAFNKYILENNFTLLERQLLTQQYNEDLNETFRKPEGPSYYVVYSFFSLVGVLGNCLLLNAVRRKVGFFGDRPTFTYLVKILAVLDLILSAIIPLEMILVTLLHSAYHYELFIHPRNIVLIFESYILVLIALDRYLALRRPFSQTWNQRTIRRLLFVLFSGTALLDMMDLAQKMISIFLLHQHPNILGYIIGVTVLLLLTMLLNYVIYVLLLFAHHNYMRTLQTSLVASLMRNTTSSSLQERKVNQVRTTRKTSSPSHQPSMGSQVQNNTDNCSELLEVSSGDDAGRQGHTIIPLTSDNPSVSVYEVVEERRIILRNQLTRRSSLRLVRVFLCVTSVYTISLVPHALAGWHLITFPGYIVYHLFYLNAIVNPFIYSVNDANCRKIIWNTVAKTFRRCSSSNSV